MLQNWIHRKPFASQYCLHLVPVSKHCERINVLKIEILVLHGAIQRQQFQGPPSTPDVVEPRGQRSEGFIIAIAETLECLPNIFIQKRGIVPDAQLKSQQLVVRPSTGMFFQSIGYFEKPHRGCGSGGGSTARTER